MDFNGSGSLTMRYLWGPTGIVARQTSGGTVSWYLADHLGTVRDLINNSGSIIDHVDFSAFGTVLGETSPTSGDRMTGFAMLERDTVTGLNLAVYREENPGTGRWDSQDPLGFGAGDSNLYRYVGNTPSDSQDQMGLADPPSFWALYWEYSILSNNLTNLGNNIDQTYKSRLNYDPLADNRPVTSTGSEFPNGNLSTPEISDGLEKVAESARRRQRHSVPV